MYPRQKRQEEAGEEIYFQFVIESMIPNMFHILPILHNTIMDRIIYIQLMSKLRASLPNNYILKWNKTKTYMKSNYAYQLCQKDNNDLILLI